MVVVIVMVMVVAQVVVVIVMVMVVAQVGPNGYCPKVGSVANRLRVWPIDWKCDYGLGL